MYRSDTMVLTTATVEILKKLDLLLQQMSAKDYNQPLSVLSGNSIGKHVRHILEFYHCLIQGFTGNIVNYDKRNRDVRLETELGHVFYTMNAILEELAKNTADINLILEVNLSQENETCQIDTSYYRELAYNIEHAIHHFALIQIGINSELTHLSIPKDFGLAYSTIKYQHECAQ